jgi:D-alanine-D-alanine ligase-like ATP-grasp enzyme
VLNGNPIAKLKRSILNDAVDKMEYVLSKKSFLEESGQLITDNPYRVSNFSTTKQLPEIYTNFNNYEKDIFKKIADKFSLNFYAADCIEKDSELFVLEINSNPGVEVLSTQDKDSTAYGLFEKIIISMLESL